MIIPSPQGLGTPLHRTPPPRSEEATAIGWAAPLLPPFLDLLSSPIFWLAFLTWLMTYHLWLSGGQHGPYHSSMICGGGCTGTSPSGLPAQGLSSREGRGLVGIQISPPPSRRVIKKGLQPALKSSDPRPATRAFALIPNTQLENIINVFI